MEDYYESEVLPQTGADYSTNKKTTNKNFYLVCDCGYRGKKGEVECANCGSFMWRKSQAGRVLKNGTIKL